MYYVRYYRRLWLGCGRVCFCPTGRLKSCIGTNVNLTNVVGTNVLALMMNNVGSNNAYGINANDTNVADNND